MNNVAKVTAAATAAMVVVVGITLWIVPVGSTRLFIAAATKEGAKLKRQVRQIVESIRLAEP